MNARELIREKFHREVLDYKNEDVYCSGKIRFNFQVDTTVDFRNPFQREDDIDYERELANYLIGAAADVKTNGGGLLIIRGGTGSGKTTSISRAILLAERQLGTQGKLDIIHLEFNNLSSVVGAQNEEEFRLYLWREFGSELQKYVSDFVSLDHELLEYLFWLERKETRIRNQIGTLYRFFEKNKEIVRGISEGTGLLNKSVDELKELFLTDWLNTFDRFSDEEVALFNLSKLKFALEKEVSATTHRAIVIDNVDHLNPSIQRLVVDTAIWASEFLGLRLVIAVRPLTWENQHGHHSLEIEEHLSPSVGDVVVRRLRYIKNNYVTDDQNKSVVQSLINEIKADHSHLRNILYGSSGVSIRAAIRNFRNFLSSPVIDQQSNAASTFPLKPSWTARAFFHGNEQAIDHENIDDLYSVSRARDPRLALLKPRVLDYIVRKRGGRALLRDIFAFILSFGYEPDELTAAVNELLLRKRALLWCNSFERISSDYSQNLTALICIAPMGASYFSRLYGEYLYTEACLATSRRERLYSNHVVNFSKDLIIEDERQISVFLGKKSAADYYSNYGIDWPSISYVYWEKFEAGASARQDGRGIENFDPGWRSRIRGYLSGTTSYDYLRSTSD